MHAKMGTEIRWAFNALAWKPTKQQLLLALSSISPEENKRVQKFLFKDDYKLGLVGRLLIRKCIHTVLHIPWKEIVLDRSEKGKPKLGNDLQERTFSFNISHQGNYTVLAASTAQNVGIDIMKFVTPNNTDIPSFFKLMKGQFVEGEWKYIHNFENEWTKLKAFYRLWCLKESYVKAVGVGIGSHSAALFNFRINTRLLDVSDDCNDSVLYLKNLPQSWTFHECLLDDNHIVAVAMETSESRDMVKFEHISFDSLIEDAETMLTPVEDWWSIYEQKYVKNK